MKELPGCAGISLTSSTLKFAEVEKANNVLQLINAGQTFVSPPINFNTQDENVIQEQFQNAFEELKVKKTIVNKVVSFTLPTELFITIQLPYDKNLNQQEVKEEISWEISQLYPYISIDELALKFYEMDSRLFQTKPNALIVALNKKFLMLIKNFCKKNDLTPKLVDSASITANSFVNSFYPDTKPVTIHICNERNSITLFINIDSRPAFVKVVQKRGGDFTNKVMAVFSKNIIEESLSGSMKSAILSGEELENELIEEIGRGTDLVFEKLNPFEVIKFKSNNQPADLLSEQFSSFVPAVGIATRFR